MDRTKMLVTYFKLSEKERQERFLAKSSAELLNKKIFALGSAHFAVLQEDGTVTAFGDNRFGQCEVTGWTDIAKIAAGDFHTVALKKDGTAVAAGDNTYGQCEVEQWAGLTDVFAQNNLTVGVKEDGSIVTAALAEASGEQRDDNKEIRDMLTGMTKIIVDSIEGAANNSVVQIREIVKTADGARLDPLPPEEPDRMDPPPQVQPDFPETSPVQFQYSFGKNGLSIDKYTGNSESVVIPRTIQGKPVSVISGHAFEKNNRIKSVTLSDSVTQILAYAFKSCNKLEELKIPANSALNRISECAFENCSSLKRLTLPESLHVIGRWAFAQCTSLESVIIPNSISTVGFGAFSECPKLKNVYLTEKAQNMLGRLDLIFDNLNVVRILPPPRGV